MEIITSTQNKKIKERAKLLKKKERDLSNLFIVEGKHLIDEAEKANALVEIYQLEGCINPSTLEPIICSQQVLNKLSSQKSNAKMIGICRKQKHDKHENDVALFLDDIQDPGNVGTILRSAYSFGVNQIYLSKACADIYNPKTIQSTKGALFHLNFEVVDLLETIQRKQEEGMKIYATALHHDSISLQECKPPKSYGIVLGNEGQGVHEQIIQQCDQTLYIEMDRFESLNVAIATSIVLYTLKHK